MKKIAALIVDDELESRNTLHNFLLKYCRDVEVVAEAASIAEAVTAISSTSPQLVFLDINMPGENGFDLFHKIPEPDFQVIFVTAYNEYAIKAFKYRAFDYILKPIDINELVDTVNRIKKLQDYKINTNQLKALLQSIPRNIPQERIALPVHDGLLYVQIDDIIRCEADGNYTIMQFTNRSKITVCRTLGNYEEMLKDRGFARVHHQHLINLRHVEKYLRGRGGTVIMSDKKEIEVSHRRKEDFLKLLNELF